MRSSLVAPRITCSLSAALVPYPLRLDWLPRRKDLLQVSDDSATSLLATKRNNSSPIESVSFANLIDEGRSMLICRSDHVHVVPLPPLIVANCHVLRSRRVFQRGRFLTGDDFSSASGLLSSSQFCQTTALTAIKRSHLLLL